jgi:hypothetical protein
MDPMIDFVRERTTDLQRTAESVHRERDLRQPGAPLGVAVVAGRLERPTPLPTTAAAASTEPGTTAAPAAAAPKTADACGPCPTDTARQAA